MTTLIFSVLFSISASAYDVKVGGIYYNLIAKGKKAEVTSGDNKYTGAIAIPSTISYNGEMYNVTSIVSNAFSSCSKLTSITIPNSVTSIGGSAFYYCTSLTSITIPSSVTSIEGAAFYGCSSLKSITIPNSVTSIGASTFFKCSSLTSVTIPNSVTSIGSDAFNSCTSLTSITIPNSVTSIGERAFSSCTSLKSITIPNSVTMIEGSTFSGCTSLTSITIPNSVTIIGEAAFSWCSGLKSITIPNSVTSIVREAFSSCTSLTSITIPNSVTIIGEAAFSGCTSLTSVTIPNSVTMIEYATFAGCTSLTSITIPNSVTSILPLAFYGCSSLRSVTIPNSKIGIGESAFQNCKNLENVYCYAEKVPGTETNAFKDSYVEYATLHVPASAINEYKTTEPWSSFGTFKILEGTEIETKKCEAPTIAYKDGELSFTCATEGVEYISEVNCADVSKFYTSTVALTACYDIKVYATKAGYENSDVATAKLYWLTSSGSLDANSINSIAMRGIAIQTTGGFINISGLDDNEKVSLYTIDGRCIGTATAFGGAVSFSAQTNSIVVAKIGKESVKIAVE